MTPHNKYIYRNYLNSKPMVNIITAQEVIDIAFAENTNMKAASINKEVIHTAELKYIKPVLGAVYDNRDMHAEFFDNYVKSALAFFVKVEVIPSLSINLSNGGAVVINPQYSTPATDKQRMLLIDSELGKAQTLLDEAVCYILDHAEDFPEFKQQQATPKYNIIGGVIL